MKTQGPIRLPKNIEKVVRRGKGALLVKIHDGIYDDLYGILEVHPSGRTVMRETGTFKRILWEWKRDKWGKEWGSKTENYRSPTGGGIRAKETKVSHRRSSRTHGRDISRADLKHLSGAALLKLLRQAVRKGDEDMAEAIGKELDRRGGGFRRDAEDDYQFEGRVMQAARLARIVWKPSQMSAQQWPPRYAHVREAGGEFFVVAPHGDVVGVFASLPVAVRKARGVGRLYLRKYGRE